MKRKFIVLFFILILISNSFIVSYANPVVLVLGTKEILALGGLLVGGGLVYANQDDIKKSVADMYYNFMDSDIREDFNNAVAGATNSVVSFSTDVWDSVKSYVSGLTGTESTLENIGISDGVIYGDPSTNSVSYSTVSVYGMSFSFGIIDTYNEGTDNEYYEWKFTCNGEFKGYSKLKSWSDDEYEYSLYHMNSLTYDSVYAPWFETWVDEDNTLVLAVCYVDLDGDIHKKDNRFKMLIDEVETGDTVDVGFGIALEVPVPGTQTYSYSVISATDSWNEWDNEIEEEGKIEVFIPPSLEDLEGDSWQNVKEQDYDTEYEIDTGSGTGEGTSTTTVDVTATDFTDVIESKLSPSVFTNAFERLNEIDTTKGEPPVIYINLHDILGTAKNIGSFSNVFDDKETVFIDFGVLEDYSFGGYTVVDYFRMLIGVGFVWNTVLYCWRKIVPDKAVL